MNEKVRAITSVSFLTLTLISSSTFILDRGTEIQTRHDDDTYFFFIMRPLVLLSALVALVSSEEVKLSLRDDLDVLVALTDGGTHYGNPETGCQEDETAFAINGVPGKICAPQCTDFQPCPTDVPKGCTATPTCALKSPNGATYCALVCQPGSLGDDQCGADAECQPISNVGICTYGGDL